ncbi:MAG TPA: hypothetical protein VFG32_08015 [Bacteroidota bacterium]|nr:hypothetical protein [Bacteroidota bacterium]
MNTKARPLALVAALAGLLVAVLLLGGCGEKKMEPVAVSEMETYHDPGIGFSITHPKGWIKNAEVGRARFYNAQDVDKKFLDPTGVGAIGVEISVSVIKTHDPASQIKQFKDDLTTQGYVLQPEQSVSVGPLTGTKMGYTANYGAKNIINGHHVLIAGDSVVYDLGFAGFGDYYTAYAAVFEASLNSFEAPKPKEKGRDETLPSEEMAKYDGKMFSFQYPDNFNFQNTAKGKFDEVVDLRGVRLDCSIRFDVFAAQKLTVEKVVEQNKGTYKAKSTGKATIGGESAMFINYSSRADVDSRVYFVVKNDKVVRITLSWFKPQGESYIPVYEKVISSIEFK